MIYIPYLESSAPSEAPESEVTESEVTESETPESEVTESETPESEASESEVSESETTEIEATEPIALSTPKPRDGREPLRHLLLGSQEGVDKAIQRMQVLQHYAEQFLWSKPIAVPETGILITPNQGDVLRYLLRWRAIP